MVRVPGQGGSLRFALNHMVAPRVSLSKLLTIAKAVGVDAVEVRNDLDGVEILDGTSAASIRAKASSSGTEILSINALQRFNDWSKGRESEARSLINFASECGAAFIVLCPVNDSNYNPMPDEKSQSLYNAIIGLKPMLEDAGVVGLIEPLGFSQSSLRSKRSAVQAIRAANAERIFKLVHDTFHHFVAGEREVFADFTGLVHVSGIADAALSREDMRDGHRGLVFSDDLIGNVEQLQALRREGYAGAVSFEPFSSSVANAPNIADDLGASIGYLRGELV
jgi:2-keto-myo-inositol isomerase